MKCQKCGEEFAIFQGNVARDIGPTEADAANTPENLPGGYAWLCVTCENELYQPRATVEMTPEQVRSMFKAQDKVRNEDQTS